MRTVIITIVENLCKLIGNYMAGHGLHKCIDAKKAGNFKSICIALGTVIGGLVILCIPSIIAAISDI